MQEHSNKIMKITQRENGIKSLSTKNLIVISSNFSLISLSDKQFLVLKQHQKLTASEFLQTTKKLFLRLKKLIEFLIFAKEAYELFE